MSHQVIIAIDPGNSGALVIRHKSAAVEVIRMPDSMPGQWDLLKRLRALDDAAHPLVVLERVGTARKGNSARSAHTFAEHVGGLKMALVGLGYPEPLSPLPQQWMAGLWGKDGYPHGSGYAEVKARKEFIFNAALRFFPGTAFPKYAGDAVALLEWGIRNAHRQRTP